LRRFHGRFRRGERRSNRRRNGRRACGWSNGHLLDHLLGCRHGGRNVLGLRRCGRGDDGRGRGILVRAEGGREEPGEHADAYGRKDRHRDRGGGQKGVKARPFVARGAFVLPHGVVLLFLRTTSRLRTAGPGGSKRVLRLVTASGCYSGRMCGKRMTSRMLGLSVRSITRRSMPRPAPAVGGRPYSSARM